MSEFIPNMTADELINECTRAMRKGYWDRKLFSELHSRLLELERLKGEKKMPTLRMDMIKLKETWEYPRFKITTLKCGHLIWDKVNMLYVGGRFKLEDLDIALYVCDAMNESKVLK